MPVIVTSFHQLVCKSPFFAGCTNLFSDQPTFLDRRQGYHSFVSSFISLTGIQLLAYHHFSIEAERKLVCVFQVDLSINRCLSVT
jgi:hypothetical protein